MRAAEVRAAQGDLGSLAQQEQGKLDIKNGTVLDMLRKVPMVSVDGQDNITVNGSSSFKVYVDGKPNQMLSANPSPIFKVMPASSVKEIQVITNPGAKYDAEGTGGVLNLVTGAGAGEKLVQDGVYGTVGIGGTYNGRFGNNTGVFLNAQKGRWTFGADVNAGVQRNPTVTIDESQVLESAGMYSAQTRHHDGLNRSPMLFGNLSASFELDSTPATLRQVTAAGPSRTSRAFPLWLCSRGSRMTTDILWSIPCREISQPLWLPGIP